MARADGELTLPAVSLPEIPVDLKAEARTGRGLTLPTFELWNQGKLSCTPLFVGLQANRALQ
jgi:hypothetical protein